MCSGVYFHPCCLGVRGRVSGTWPKKYTSGSISQESSLDTYNSTPCQRTGNAHSQNQEFWDEIQLPVCKHVLLRVLHFENHWPDR